MGGECLVKKLLDENGESVFLEATASLYTSLEPPVCSVSFVSAFNPRLGLSSFPPQMFHGEPKRHIRKRYDGQK